MTDERWYRKGLRFQCTRCGHCCRGAPGNVRVSEAEIGALSRRLGLEEAEFRGLYTRSLRGGDVSLRELRNGDCVFYEAGRGCGVYSDRPAQCRSYPFWSAVLHSAERWSEEGTECPGIDTGPLWSEERIRHILADEEG